jgi:NhaP-type Na+/H+ or K+/H+ antiporter
VASQLAAARLRIPAIVPLLAVGVLLGPYVLGAVDPDQLFGELIDPFVELAVGVILFEGALLLRRSDLEGGAGQVVLRLVTVGFLLTWALISVAAAVILEFDTRIAILLGAVLSLSGPTVVLPLLEHVRPTRRVGTVLTWEGILIDPVGAIFAVLAFGAISTGDSEFRLAEFVLTVGAGAAIGLGFALLTRIALRSPGLSVHLESSSVLALVLVAVAVASELRDDAGLVAAIAMGVALAGEREQIEKRAPDFLATLSSLLIGILFVVLAARVDPARLTDLGWEGVAFAAVLVLAIRPLAAFIGTVRSPLTRGERGLVAWMMPRGIVAAATASAFELALISQGIEGADRLVPATFLVVVVTVVVYGLTAKPLARALGVTR